MESYIELTDWEKSQTKLYNYQSLSTSIVNPTANNKLFKEGVPAMFSSLKDFRKQILDGVYQKVGSNVFAEKFNWELKSLFCLETIFL